MMLVDAWWVFDVRDLAWMASCVIVGIPVAAWLPIAIAGGQITTSVLGNRAASQGAQRAATAQRGGIDAQIAFEREQREEDRKEQERLERERREADDRARAEEMRRFDLSRSDALREFESSYALQARAQAINLESMLREENRQIDMYNFEQARRQPYRDVSWAATQELANLAGLEVVRTEAPQLEGAFSSLSYHDLLSPTSGSYHATGSSPTTTTAPAPATETAPPTYENLAPGQPSPYHVFDPRYGRWVEDQFLRPGNQGQGVLTLYP